MRYEQQTQKTPPFAYESSAVCMTAERVGKVLNLYRKILRAGRSWEGPAEVLWLLLEVKV